jgi:hypothetical protein
LPLSLFITPRIVEWFIVQAHRQKSVRIVIGSGLSSRPTDQDEWSPSTVSYQLDVYRYRNGQERPQHMTSYRAFPMPEPLVTTGLYARISKWLTVPIDHLRVRVDTTRQRIQCVLREDRLVPLQVHLRGIDGTVYATFPATVHQDTPLRRVVESMLVHPMLPKRVKVGIWYVVPFLHGRRVTVSTLSEDPMLRRGDQFTLIVYSPDQWVYMQSVYQQWMNRVQQRYHHPCTFATLYTLYQEVFYNNRSTLPCTNAVSMPVVQQTLLMDTVRDMAMVWQLSVLHHTRQWKRWTRVHACGLAQVWWNDWVHLGRLRRMRENDARVGRTMHGNRIVRRDPLWGVSVYTSLDEALYFALVIQLHGPPVSIQAHPVSHPSRCVEQLDAHQHLVMHTGGSWISCRDWVLTVGCPKPKCHTTCAKTRRVRRLRKTQRTGTHTQTQTVAPLVRQRVYIHPSK